MLDALPVSEVRDEVVGAFSGGERDPAMAPRRLLLRAPTGSGKSTGVPVMILEAGIVDGLIVVVQPRRIAARMLARRVAQLRGGRVGDEVGYVVRHDRKMGSGTRIVFVTDGVLQRWLADGQLDGTPLEVLTKTSNGVNVGCVLFDEFHERRLASDLALAHCLALQEGGRGDLRVGVMSATLEVKGLEDYLGDCAVVEAGGRAFPVEVSYRAAAVASRRGGGKREEIWDRAAGVVRDVISDEDCGHVLVFMPGVYEIRRTCELIERSGWSKGWGVFPLYGALSPEAQDAAVYGDGGRRIIVATNVAETSLTIDGVRTVVDAGLARVARFDAVRGVDVLGLEKISRASAEQRAGRAGRTAAGRAVRLWSEAEHGRRAGFEVPEVRRVDLAETVLELKVRGVGDVMNFRWLDAPDAGSVREAEVLLEELGALAPVRGNASNGVNAEGGLTELGVRMGRLGMHPRYGRLLLAAAEEGCVAEAAFAAAVVQGEGVFVRNARERESFFYDEDGSDFAGEWRGFDAARRMNFDARRCCGVGVMGRGAREVGLAFEQLKGVCLKAGLGFGEVDFGAREDAFGRAMLAAFSDRLAVRLNAGTLACRLSGGRRGKLDSGSVVKGDGLFLVTEMREVDGKDVFLGRCVGVTEEDVRRAFDEDFCEVDGAVWDETIRRVVRRAEVRFRDLVISSKSGGDPDGGAAAAILAERVAAGELKLKKWDGEVEQWIARLLCLREWMPELELPGFDEEDRAIAFEAICEGAIGYKDIKDREVMPALLGWLSGGQLAALDAYAPARIKLANGEGVKVRYEVGKAPVIAVRVQRLFGVEETPVIAGGKVRVCVHVCAPNQRPWQMTEDLAGFWERGFPQMVKDLGGRYPKHRWER